MTARLLALGVASLLAAACAAGNDAGHAGSAGAGNADSGVAGVVLADIDVESVRARHPTSLFGIPPAAARAEVVRVVDGDTIAVVFEGGRTENVRLIGIDTPEKPGGNLPAECFGAEATAFTSVLLPPGTPVLLTGGAETRDVYDRLLAYVHRSTDGLLVNMALAREGYAAALSIAPNTDYSGHFAGAVEAARAENLGLWAACGGPDTPLEG
ncbi:MAG: thermonuclease family protein [Acidimicrobiia bacterium]|nr:thermonuclease family protein [Acidimicrobiia bacterium]MYC46188.1 thermonuclease family protein [Acidimicrobiia bacterium]